VERLAQWNAVRSSKPPNTKQEILERGLIRCPRLDQQFQQIRQKVGKREPSIDNLTWEDIAPLFDVMSEIKGCKSPVFASKLGHFMFPRAFFVIDNKATSTFPYEVVWRGLRDGWQSFTDKQLAKKLLTAEIPESIENLHPDYPFETKIPEMWLIGYNHRLDS
jgi:hypothetical protein